MTKEMIVLRIGGTFLVFGVILILYNGQRDHMSDAETQKITVMVGLISLIVGCLLFYFGV